MGAGQWQVLWLVERQGMTMVAAGLAIGLVGAMVSTRFMHALLFRVGSRDPLTFAGCRNTGRGLARRLLSPREAGRPSRPCRSAAVTPALRRSDKRDRLSLWKQA